ncbi:MAG: GNAT family N-acetyltransferase [Chloracidobacterium sp.]|nr:GNAT family N-acetyltransferase [Chloracidobacterium sp.]
MLNYNSYNSETSSTKMEWCEVPSQSFHVWDQKLASTDCPYLQFPFWVKAHEEQGYRTRFFYYGDVDRPIATAAIMEAGRFPFRFALVDRGPFIFSSSPEDAEKCVLSLIELAKNLDYAFVRFTHGQDEVFSILRRSESVKSLEPYPFSRDPRNFLIVQQKDTKHETLATFNETARRKIRKAADVGYEFRIASSKEDFDLAWDLFERLALRKRFNLSSKPKRVWKKIIELGAENARARLYLCTYEDKLVAAQIIVSGGVIAEGTLSALDVDALEGKPSPAALLTWIGMRDAQELGCNYFDMGGPGDPKRNNHVFEFKRMFRPEGRVMPGPVCAVIHPVRHWIWMKVILRGWRAWRARFACIQVGFAESFSEIHLLSPAFSSLLQHVPV